MEFIAGDIDWLDLLVSGLDTIRVEVGIDLATYLEAGLTGKAPLRAFPWPDLGPVTVAAAGGDRCLHRRIDRVEPRVPIRMLTPRNCSPTPAPASETGTSWRQQGAFV